MAIISCPACGKRTSSVAPDCSVCGAALTDPDPERTKRFAARARRARARSLNLQATLATFIGVGGGFWLMFGAGPRQGGWQQMLAAVLFVGGLAWYAYVRVAQWLARRR